ncbi:MAG: hypothetical protein AAF467_21615 [Actinomycetota bacterium]
MYRILEALAALLAMLATSIPGLSDVPVLPGPSDVPVLPAPSDVPVLPGPPVLPGLDATPPSPDTDQPVVPPLFQQADLSFLLASLDGGGCVSTSGKSGRFLVVTRNLCEDTLPLWKLADPEEGAGHLIRGTRGDVCWAVDGASKVVTSPCAGGLDQRWTIEQSPSGLVVTAALDGRCLERRGRSLAVGPCTGATNQLWGSYHYPD